MDDEEDNIFMDAADDTQYVNATTGGGPSSNEAFKFPSKLLLDNWKQSSTSSSPSFFTPNDLLAHPLVFYIFGRYCKEDLGGDSQVTTSIMLLEDLCRYRMAHGDYVRESLAKKIQKDYLSEGGGHVEVVDMVESTLMRLSPIKLNDIPPLVAASAGGNNILKIGGIILSDANSSITSSKFPSNLFDQLDSVVYSSLTTKIWKRFEESGYYSTLLNYMYLSTRSTNLDDFTLFRLLGRGGFGLVHGCKKNTSGKLYAMKVVNKKRVKVKRAEAITVAERYALGAVSSHFVVNLTYAFTTDTDLYLVMDLLTGGDLNYHLKSRTKFEKVECQYYAARICLGVQALHAANYVYRDLKPENILMGDDGRIKIIDFGLATQVTPSLMGAAGTRGYWPPEMLRRNGQGKKSPYGFSADWFSFGCMLAEFITGVSPFRNAKAVQFGKNKGIKNKGECVDAATLEMEPDFTDGPMAMDEDARDLCTRLIKKFAEDRIGTNSPQEIMDHPWFDGLDWEGIKSDTLQPPYVPPKDVNAQSQESIGTFQSDPDYKNIEKQVLEEKDHKFYHDWTWTCMKSFESEVVEFLQHEKSLGKQLVKAGKRCCVIS